MASSKATEREARVARDRLRRFTARQTVHEHKMSRRRRDNILGVTLASVVIVAAAVTQVLYFASGPGSLTPDPAASPSAAESASPAAEGTNIGDVPPPTLSESRTWTGGLVLNDVSLSIELDGTAAPQAVSSFIQDVQLDYYPGKSCHRLTNAGFYVLQCGSIDGTGSGDPDYRYGPIENAPADNVYPAGTIAMARAGGDAYSNGHQFFIVYEDTTIQADAAGGYTVIGMVTSGLDQLREQIAGPGVVDGGKDGAPVVNTTITAVSLTQ